MRPHYLLLYLALCSLATVQAQNNPNPLEPLVGKVTDSTGSPLDGATVKLANSRITTTTNENGMFTLKLPAKNSGTLLISRVGYAERQVAVNNQANLQSIQLQVRDLSLGDVVVVGYGKQKKATLTGSVSTISGSDVAFSTSPNITNALAGRAPGLVVSNFSGEPGADGAQILVRGFSTLGNSGPLFVIDGVANRDGFSNLNPTDVESITVLKDASAAIYGAQAANGVILVTTKHGKIGKPTLTYSGKYSISNPTRVPQLVNSYEYALYRDDKDIHLGAPPTFTRDQINKFKAGTDQLNYPSTDWYKTVLKPWSPIMTHSLNLTGGTDKVKYYLSGQYLNQDGFYQRSAAFFREYNLHSNLDAQVTKNFRFSIDLTGQMTQNHSTNNNSGTIFLNILGIYPYLAPYYPNGLPQAGLQGENPLQMAQGADGYNNNYNNTIHTTGSFEWKLPFILEGLSLSGFAANDYAFYNTKSFSHPFDLYRYDSTANQYNNVKGLLGFTSLNESYGGNHLGTYNLKLNFERHFGRHEVSAFVAAEQSDYYNEGISAYRKNYISTSIDQIFAGSNASSDKDNGGTADQNARQNYFARVNYSYMEKYLLEFVIRRDGSFNFPADKRWGNFPGISAGWRISEEPFFKRAFPMVNQLKLRGSYSVLGNDRIPQYQYLTTYAFDYGYYTGTGSNPAAVQGLTSGVIPNPNITWETDHNANIGIDGSLWDGKLDFTVDYFKARRNHILAQPNTVIPTSTGLSLPEENIGIVDRHGLELTLGHKGNIGKDFQYDLSGNLTVTHNNVVYDAEPSSTPAWQKVAGHPVGSYLLYQATGIYHTPADLSKSPHLPGAQPGDIQYVDYDKDGAITANDQVMSNYNPTPLVVYGLTLEGRYKGFSLNILLQGQARSSQIILPQSNNVEIIPPTWIYNNYWSPQNPNSNQPAPFDRTYTPDNQPSTFFLFNTSFLRLKSLEIGYTINPNILKRAGLSNLRIYANGFNLFTIDKVKHYDPEINNYSGAYYPQTRILTTGLTITF